MNLNYLKKSCFIVLIDVSASCLKIENTLRSAYASSEIALWVFWSTVRELQTRTICTIFWGPMNG